MYLELLTPLALAGTALVSIPIYLHLKQQHDDVKIYLPTIVFINKLKTSFARRKRIKNKLLLLLRILFLVFLIFSLSSPVFHYEKNEISNLHLRKNIIFLLDNSLSMSYQQNGISLFEIAKKDIEKEIYKLPKDSKASVMVFNISSKDLLSGIESIATLTDNKDKLISALRLTEQSHSKTDLKSAVLSAIRALSSSKNGDGDIFLFSDLTENSLADLSLDPNSTKKTRIIIKKPDVLERSNTGITQVVANINENKGLPQLEIDINLNGHLNDIKKNYSLDLFLNKEIRSRVSSKIERSVAKKFSIQLSKEGAFIGHIKLEKDNFEADNNYFFKTQNKSNYKILVIDGDSGLILNQTESFYIEKAMNPQKYSRSKLVPIVIDGKNLSSINLNSYNSVFMLNVSNPSDISSKIKSFVKNGGGLFISVGDKVVPEYYNKFLSEIIPASIGETQTVADMKNNANASIIINNTNHHILKNFKEIGYNVIAQAEFYKWVLTAPILKENASIIFKFSNGGPPALLERKVGKGRVLFFTSTLDTDWNNFPIKSSFLPFIQESAKYISLAGLDVDNSQTSYYVGDEVKMFLPDSFNGFIKAPDNKTYELSIKENDHYKFKETNIPGYYEVFEQKSVKNSNDSNKIFRSDLSFAVNVSQKECESKTLSIESLRSKIKGIDIFDSTDKLLQKGSANTSYQLNYSALWAVLIFFIAENLAVSILSHRKNTKLLDI